MILDKEPIHSLDLPVNTHSIQPWAASHHPLDEPKQVKQNVMNSTTRTKLEEENLQLHYSLGHIHPDRMQLIQYKNCRLPFCASCAYGKATRKPWRLHTSSNTIESHCPQRSGECISVDQLISPTPGFIAQMSGKLTTQRYTCATIYVDQYSGYSYI